MYLRHTITRLCNSRQIRCVSARKRPLSFTRQPSSSRICAPNVLFVNCGGGRVFSGEPTCAFLVHNRTVRYVGQNFRVELETCCGERIAPRRIKQGGACHAKTGQSCLLSNVANAWLCQMMAACRNACCVLSVCEQLLWKTVADVFWTGKINDWCVVDLWKNKP